MVTILPLCACGCGQRVHKQTSSFLRGHNSRVRTKETILKIKQTLMNHPVTKETRQKLSASLKGNIPWNKGISPSPETRKKLSLALKGRKTGRSWNKGLTKETDPRITGRTGGWNKGLTKGTDKRVRRGCHPSWNKGLTKETDERVKRTSTKLSGCHLTQEAINKMKKSLLQLYSSGKYIIWNKGLKTGPLSVEHKKALSIAHKGHKVSKSTRRKIGEKVKTHWESLSTFEQKEYLNNSFFKAKQKPNGEETKLIPILASLDFIYNTMAVVGPRRPDFVHIDRQLIIEYDGSGGHDPNVPWVPENKAELDDERDQYYQDNGYTVLRLLPLDLKLSNHKIKQKIKKWMNG